METVLFCFMMSNAFFSRFPHIYLNSYITQRCNGTHELKISTRWFYVKSTSWPLRLNDPRKISGKRLERQFSIKIRTWLEGAQTQTEDSRAVSDAYAVMPLCGTIPVVNAVVGKTT